MVWVITPGFIKTKINCTWRLGRCVVIEAVDCCSGNINECFGGGWNYLIKPRERVNSAAGPLMHYFWHTVHAVREEKIIRCIPLLVLTHGNLRANKGQFWIMAGYLQLIIYTAEAEERVKSKQKIHWILETGILITYLYRRLLFAQLPEQLPVFRDGC